MIMSAIDLVKVHPNPSEETIRAELDGNLCRCTGYHKIVQAVEWAAAKLRGDDAWTPPREVFYGSRPPDEG
jgi:carbon-monoxide dehydrogenase small subunit